MSLRQNRPQKISDYQSVEYSDPVQSMVFSLLSIPEFKSLVNRINDSLLLISNPKINMTDKKESLRDIWTSILDLVKGTPDFNQFDVVFLTIKRMGDFCMEFKDFD
jgi:hypothetical protein